MGEKFTLDDPEEVWWKPGALDWRFTENSAHYQALNKKLTRAQFSPNALRQMTEDDLVYIAGHTHDPWDAKPDSQEASDRAHKSKQNAERARVELQRRYSAKLARTNFWRSVLLAGFAALFGALVTYVVTETTKDEPARPATTVSTSVP